MAVKASIGATLEQGELAFVYRLERCGVYDSEAVPVNSRGTSNRERTLSGKVVTPKSRNGILNFLLLPSIVTLTVINVSGVTATLVAMAGVPVRG